MFLHLALRKRIHQIVLNAVIISTHMLDSVELGASEADPQTDATMTWAEQAWRSRPVRIVALAAALILVIVFLRPHHGPGGRRLADHGPGK